MCDASATIIHGTAEEFELAPGQLMRIRVAKKLQNIFSASQTSRLSSRNVPFGQIGERECIESISLISMELFWSWLRDNNQNIVQITNQPIAMAIIEAKRHRETNKTHHCVQYFKRFSFDRNDSRYIAEWIPNKIEKNWRRMKRIH